MTKVILKTVAIVLTIFISLLPIQADAVDCSGKSKSSCSSSTSCSWVSGYTTKVGTQVKAYCRARPGKRTARNMTTKKTTTKDKKRN